MHVVGLLVAAIRIYELVILVRVISSWLPPEHRANEAYRFLYAITEPFLRPFSRAVPPVGGLDFSPFVAVLLLELARFALIRMV